MLKPVGVLGGTFDPVHNGHLRLAVELLQQLDLAEVRLIPAYQPPHRSVPVASVEFRWQMLEQAIAGEPGLFADDRELRRQGMSYTVDTLASMREELGARPLCLILGIDAFRTLPKWRRWEDILTLAHIAVADRLDTEADLAPVVRNLIKQRLAQSPAELGLSPAGRIVMRSIPLLEISATRIRAALAAGHSVRYLLPDAVLSLINQHKLYNGV